MSQGMEAGLRLEEGLVDNGLKGNCKGLGQFKQDEILPFGQNERKRSV